MHYTIQLLLDGEAAVISYYQAAKIKWNELFVDYRDGSVSDWASWLTSQQVSYFEQHCGGRWEGQEVMAWSGFALLYTTTGGFGDNLPYAKKLAEAFEKSMCSIELKGGAKRAAKSYYLDDFE